MTREFSGKRVLIAGAAEGIGRETAVLLDKLGARLLLVDINQNGLNDLISNLTGKNHSYILFDFKDLHAIEAMVKSSVEEGGPFDGFVHCIGVRSRRPLSMIKPQFLSDVLSINLGSFVEVARCVTSKGNYRNELSIVGVSSISSQKGAAGITAYAASKAAIDGAVRCMAKELSSKGIRVNTVVPAQINTPAYRKLLQQSDQINDATTARQYLGLGEPADVANVITFLLSNKSRFITGAAIPVDGGFLSS